MPGRSAAPCSRRSRRRPPSSYNDDGLASGAVLVSSEGDGRSRQREPVLQRSRRSSSPTGTLLPPRPTRATPVGSTINLSWTASTDNVGVTEYLRSSGAREPAASFDSSLIAAPTATAYSDTGLNVGSYSYRVRATDAPATERIRTRPPCSDHRRHSTDSARRTSPLPRREPSVDLSWTASTDNIGVTGYQVEYCFGSGCTSFAADRDDQRQRPTATQPRSRARTPSASGPTDAAGNLEPVLQHGDGFDPRHPAARLRRPGSRRPRTARRSRSGGRRPRTTLRSPTIRSSAAKARLHHPSPSLRPSTRRPTRTRGSPSTASATGFGPSTPPPNASQYSNVATATTASTPSGPLAAYAFNEGSGTTTADASGNGVTGTLQGAAWTTAGKNGNALSFNGSTSYVDLGRPSDPELDREHDVGGVGLRHRQPRGRRPDRRALGRELRLAAEDHAGYRPAHVRNRHLRRRCIAHTAVQQDRRRAEHLVPRRRGLQRHRPDPRHLRERRRRRRHADEPGRRSEQRPECAGAAAGGCEREHRQENGRLLLQRRRRRRPHLSAGAVPGGDPVRHANRCRHHTGHATTDRSSHPDADRGQRHAGQPVVAGGHRQRRRGGLPRRALPEVPAATASHRSARRRVRRSTIRA